MTDECPHGMAGSMLGCDVCTIEGLVAQRESLIVALKASEHVAKELGKLNERIVAERDVAVAQLGKAEPQVTITRTQFLEIARQVWENDFDRTREHPEQFTLKLAEAIGLLEAGA